MIIMSYIRHERLSSPILPTDLPITIHQYLSPNGNGLKTQLPPLDTDKLEVSDMDLDSQERET